MRLYGRRSSRKREHARVQRMRFRRFESLETRQMLNAAPVANDDQYSVLQDTVLSVNNQVAYPSPTSFPALKEAQSIAINYTASQIEYSEPYSLLFVREGTTRVHVIDTTTGQQVGFQVARTNFIDLDLTPDGRYLFISDYQGNPNYVHRFDAASRTWLVKSTTIPVYRIEGIDSERFLGQSWSQGVHITLNHFGASTTDAIRELNRIRGGYEGDFEYDHRTGRIYHGSTGTSSGDIQVRAVVNNSLVYRESAERSGPYFDTGSNSVLSTDGDYFYYGQSRVRTSNVRTVQHFPGRVEAATAGLAFAGTKYYSAETGEELGDFGYAPLAYGVSDRANGIWTFDWSSQRLRRYEIPNYPLVGVMANDNDADQDRLAASVVSGPRNGVVNLDVSGAFTYTPQPGFVGSDSFAYQVTDSAGNKSTVATVTIAVRPNNTAPTAVDDKYIVEYGTTLTVTKAPIQASTYPGLNEIAAIQANYDVSQVEYAQHSGLLFVRDGTVRTRIIDVAAGVEIAQRVATEEFTDFDLSPDGRYLFVADFGNFSSSDTLRPGAVHRFDTATRQWEVKPAPASGQRIEVIDKDRFVLWLPGVPGQRGSLTLNDFGAEPATLISELAREAYEYSGDIEFHHHTGVLYHGTVEFNPILSAFTITNNAITLQTSSGPLPVLQSGSLHLSADGQYLFYGSGQFLPSDVRTIQRVYHEVITASTEGLVFTGHDIRVAETGDVVGDLGYSAALITVSDDGLHLIAHDRAESGLMQVYQVRPLGWGVLANDGDSQRDRLTASVVSWPNNGALNLNADGSFQYRARDGYSGKDSFSYVAFDGFGKSNVATVEFTVSSPLLVAAPDSYSLSEDVALDVDSKGGVLQNDTGLSKHPFNATLEERPRHGQLTLAADGSFRYVPHANYFGTDWFTYRISSEPTVSTPTTVILKILPVPDAPVAVPDSFQVREDQKLTASVTKNDTDAESDQLTAVLVAGPSNGSLTIAADGSFTYQPNANFFGTDRFSYKVNDGTQDSNVATVSIEVEGTTDDPIGMADSYTVLEDQVLFVPASEGVLHNDHDPDLEPLTAVLLTKPIYGELTFNGDGSFRYVPATNFNGTDFFTYASRDQYFRPEPIRATIHVRNTFDPPVPLEDSYSTTEDTPLIVAQNASFSYLTSPGQYNDLVYDPITDRIFATASGALSVINPSTAVTESSFFIGAGANKLALSSDGQYLYVGVDVPGEIARVNLRTMLIEQRFEVWRNFEDRWRAGEIRVFPNDPTRIAVAVAPPAHFSATRFMRIFKDGVAEPSPFNQFGNDHVIALNHDGTELFGAQSNTLHRHRVVRNEISGNTRAGAVKTGTTDLEWAGGYLFANSGQVFDTITLEEIDCFPSGGEVTVDPAADRIYFRNGGRIQVYVLSTRQPAGMITIPDVATDVFSESVRVGADGLAFATADRLVLVKSDMISGNPYSGVLRNDKVIDRRRLTAVLGTAPKHGALSLNPDGTFAYYPAANYQGKDSFSYRIGDGQYESPFAEVKLQIDPVDDPPTAQQDKYYYAGKSIQVAAPGVLTNDLDLEGRPLSAVLVKNAQHGQVQLNADGSFSYTPGPTFAGTDQFSYRAADGAISSAETIVNIASPVRMVADNVNLVLPPNAEGQGTFDVYAQVAAGFEFSVTGYAATLHTTSQNDVTLVKTSATSLPRIPLFTTAPGHQSIPNGLQVTGAASVGTALLIDGHGLFRVHFTVSSDFEGGIPLEFEIASTELLDATGIPLPIERAAGAISVKRLPGAAANTSASVTGLNRVRVSWEDKSENETGFRVERSDGAGFVPVATIAADATSFEDTKLQSSTTYTYRVRAYNAAGDGPASDSAPVRTPQLSTITGTNGNDVYHVTRTATLLQIYENVDPVGVPTYSSALADLPQTFTIETLGGHDTLFVSTGRESTLGLERLVYAPGDGSNKLTIQNGTARIDTNANGIAELETIVEVGAHLATARVSQGYLNIKSHGRVTLLANGGTSVVHHLSLGEGAALDITNNAFVIDHFGNWPLDYVREALRTGTGIKSSTAEQRNATAPGTWAVGYAENGSLPLGSYTTFRGAAVDNTAVLLAFTRNGDANLDGMVDDHDVTVLGAAYAPGVPNKFWMLGDFDYNGVVDDDDVTVVGAFYNPAGAPVAAPLPPSTAAATKPDDVTALVAESAATQANRIDAISNHVTGRRAKALDNFWANWN